jgi:HAD superfamily hydrolase (TIGR01459 family)
MRDIKGLRDIAHQFDGMIIDQFGVIHDGQRLYPGAAEILANLHTLQIPVVIVTNSGKRAAANAERIIRMGIPQAHFKACISSGEVAFQSLADKAAFLIGKRGEDYGFTGITMADDPGKAEIMLILGSNAPETTLEDYRGKLAGLTLPALCCNPDKWMLTPSGLQPAPGAIAALYEEMGGQVQWIGKPHPAIYEAARKAMGRPKHVLCIGDSAEHDVAGGRNAGLSTLLVLQGVSQGLNPEDLKPAPDFVAASFTW